MMKRWLVGAALAAGVAACRGRPPGTADAPAVRATVDSLIPLVEKAVGIKFKKPPRFEMRTKQQVQEFLRIKLGQEFPAGKMAGIEAAYRLLELLPDTLDIKSLLLPLYSEQVAGYYDPDSTTLYAVEGAKGDQLRLVLAHELVHALQHERLPLETMLKDVTNADRLAASQAVLEGHATVAMLGVVMPDREVLADPNFWGAYREQVKAAQSSMPVFQKAPLILREGLIFPYLAGAEFMRWWAIQGGDRGPLPTREQLPQSTEQILHPDRYLANDRPVDLQFADPKNDDVLYEDTMGEFELQIWATQMRNGSEVLTDLPIGWAGDRFRVYRTPAGPALVLYTAWDDSTAAGRFAKLTAARFVSRPRPGYRTTAEVLTLAARATVRIVRAPESWARWSSLPELRSVSP